MNKLSLIGLTLAAAHLTSCAIPNAITQRAAEIGLISAESAESMQVAPTVAELIGWGDEETVASSSPATPENVTQAPAETSTPAQPTEAPTAIPVAKPAEANSELQTAKAEFLSGTAAANEARYNDAIRHFEASAALFPRASTHFNLGYCFEAQAAPDRERARSEYQKALQLDPAHALARAALNALNNVQN